MTQNNSDNGAYILLVILVIFFLVLLVFGAVSGLRSFSQELKILNCEIRRTRGAERKHYIRQRRRLWLSLIPFVKY